jgi:hypothetical protein
MSSFRLIVLIGICLSSIVNAYLPGAKKIVVDRQTALSSNSEPRKWQVGNKGDSQQGSMFRVSDSMTSVKVLWLVTKL